jgi:hypothetical protein
VLVEHTRADDAAMPIAFAGTRVRGVARRGTAASAGGSPTRYANPGMNPIVSTVYTADVWSSMVSRGSAGKSSPSYTARSRCSRTGSATSANVASAATRAGSISGAPSKYTPNARPRLDRAHQRARRHRRPRESNRAIAEHLAHDSASRTARAIAIAPGVSA